MNSLTIRQLECLKLTVEKELSMKEIAYEMGCSIKTVEKHRQAICRKLNAHHLQELARKSFQQNLCSIETWLNLHTHEERNNVGCQCTP